MVFKTHECLVDSPKYICQPSTLTSRPTSLHPLSLMKFITKRHHPKPVADSNPWAVGRKKAKQPKFKDKDLNQMAEFADMFGLNYYDTGWNASRGTSAYIEDEDDTSSISSCSTNATMDNIPGTGRTLDMCFYQPVGRAIEKFALKIAIRLNICHPSPAQILRLLLRLSPWYIKTWPYIRPPPPMNHRLTERRSRVTS